MEARKLFVVVLPPSHPFAQRPVDAFERLFGPHAERVISRPIPTTTEK
jgi:hypothetical protein